MPAAAAQESFQYIRPYGPYSVLVLNSVVIDCGPESPSSISTAPVTATHSVADPLPVEHRYIAGIQLYSRIGWSGTFRGLAIRQCCWISKICSVSYHYICTHLGPECGVICAAMASTVATVHVMEHKYKKRKTLELTYKPCIL